MYVCVYIYMYVYIYIYIYACICIESGSLMARPEPILIGGTASAQTEAYKRST